MITDLALLSTRQLQKEAARALAAGEGFGNQDLVIFNKAGHHDSLAWYRAVIEWYVQKHGGMPSAIGPGVDVNLILGDDDAPGNL
jgi:hypothetical protein